MNAAPAARTPPLRLLHDFDSAGRQVLAYLHRHLGFGLWMLTRTEGDDWIVLQTEDHGYGVAEGTVFRWADSFCSRMVRGEGPRVAPDSSFVPAYLDAPIARQVDIGAYIGVPIHSTDGALFGTLCAIDPAPQDRAVVDSQDLVELLAGLLGTVLSLELSGVEARRRAERLEVEVLTDGPTGLYNRRAWDRLLAREDERCRRYGHPAAVVMVDLDGLKRVNDTQGHAAGDALIAAAAQALRSSARDVDVVARLGGDEFGVLAVECDRAGATELVRRLRTGLAQAGVRASVGMAVRVPGEGLGAACAEADRAMYAQKRAAAG